MASGTSRNVLLAVSLLTVALGGCSNYIAQLRAVSYGEDRNRPVRDGAVGEAGRDNRRVALVIDYAGAPRTAAM